jgi:hypothetical protein
MYCSIFLKVFLIVAAALLSSFAVGYLWVLSDICCLLPSLFGQGFLGLWEQLDRILRSGGGLPQIFAFP